MVLRIDEISAATFDHDGAASWRAIVQAPEVATRDAMVQGADFLPGSVLPLVDLIGCPRLGCASAVEWTGAKALSAALSAS